jgi:hypothetical protein
VGRRSILNGIRRVGLRHHHQRRLDWRTWATAQLHLDDLFNGAALCLRRWAQIEAARLASVDNDPFSEWDFTINEAADAFNFSREGRNYFPADFFGFGLQAEYTFGSSVYSTLTYYDGERVDATSVGGGTASERPGMLRLNFRYPFTNNSSFGLDFIAAGERDGLSDPIGLVRGEFKIHF